MPITGVSFKKLSGERTGVLTADMKIDSNLSISELKKEESNNIHFLRFVFKFKVSYQEAGNLEIESNVLYTDKKEEIENIHNNFKKNKELPTELKTSVYNQALYKCSLKALSLAEDLGLPAHIRFPYVESKKD